MVFTFLFTLEAILKLIAYKQVKCPVLMSKSIKKSVILWDLSILM